ncbi:MAG: DUF2190 family protein [Stenotrophomonas sp.]
MDAIPWTNTTEQQVASGQAVVVGHQLGVARSTIAVGATGSVALGGVFTLLKVQTAVFEQGESSCRTQAPRHSTEALRQLLPATSLVRRLPGLPAPPVRRRPRCGSRRATPQRRNRTDRHRSEMPRWRERCRFFHSDNGESHGHHQHAARRTQQQSWQHRPYQHAVAR